MQDIKTKRLWDGARTWRRLAVVSVGLLIVAAACLSERHDDEWMASQPQYCSCNGTTLHCDGPNESQKNMVFDTPNSQFCDQNALNNKGACHCEDTTLICEFDVTYGNSKIVPFLTATPNNSENAPISNNDNEPPAHLVFPNSLICGGIPVEVTEAPTEVSTEQPTEVCSSGWLPDSGCTCCGSTLVCSDGSIGDFNPQCTGGGAEPTQCDPATGACP